MSFASVADPKAFRSGRNFSAWIGLVPKQHSSGGKDKLGSISKQGDRYLRSLFTAGARGCTDQPANVKKPLANSEPSTHGTSRQFAGCNQSGSNWSKADMPRPRAAYRSVEFDPQPTLAGSKSRSAAVCRRAVMCYHLRRA